MPISITGGGSVGITVESDPTALKLTGGTLSGELELPQVGNLLNQNLVIDSYNDTGAGTHYYHTFTPFDGKFNLATNGGGLTFPNGTTQVTAGLPLTGGTLSGKVNLAPISASSASLNLGIGTAPTSAVAGDIWIGTNINYKDSVGTQKAVANTNTVNNFLSNQIISCTSINAGLRITQLGTGNAIEVEDTTTPDSTAFTITNDGTVKIGSNTFGFGPAKLQVLSDSGTNYAVTVEGGMAGMVLQANTYPLICQSFTDAPSTFNAISVSGGKKIKNLFTNVTTGVGTYDKEVSLTLDGVNYLIPCRQV